MEELHLDLETSGTLEQLRNLKAGTALYLTGKILTGRDAAHKRIEDLLKEGKDPGIDLKNRILYYMGPTPKREGNPIGSCGPTSSYRMDPFLETTCKLGLAASIGKGERADSVTSIVTKYRAPYLITIGGAAAYLANCVKSSKIVLFEDLGAEAVLELEVDSFPLIVAIDSSGDSIF